MIIVKETRFKLVPVPTKDPSLEYFKLQVYVYIVYVYSF